MKQLQLPKKKTLAKYEQQVDDGTKPLAKPEVLLLPNVLCLYLHFLRFLCALVDTVLVLLFDVVCRLCDVALRARCAFSAPSREVAVDVFVCFVNQFL